MMERVDCLEALARHVTDADIVLPVYTTAFDWIDIRPHPLNSISGTRFVRRFAKHPRPGGGVEFVLSLDDGSSSR
jgi:hypothetical protein